jgi:hypothetical protein
MAHDRAAADIETNRDASFTSDKQDLEGDVTASGRREDWWSLQGCVTGLTRGTMVV